MTLPRTVVAVGFALALASYGAAAQTAPDLPPGRTGRGGSGQAAGPGGQNPGQAGEIGGAGPHPGPNTGPRPKPDETQDRPATRDRR